MKQQESWTAVVLWHESGVLLGQILEAAAATEASVAKREMDLSEGILMAVLRKRAPAFATTSCFSVPFFSLSVASLAP